MFQRPVHILLVEDSPADIRLAREALLQGSVPKRISVVTDGAQAIDFVRRRGEFQNAARPDLVLLDINLPKRDGLDVLREIKSDPVLRSITVIVLTTSQFQRDVKGGEVGQLLCCKAAGPGPVLRDDTRHRGVLDVACIAAYFGQRSAGKPGRRRTGTEIKPSGQIGKRFGALLSQSPRDRNAAPGLA